ncbi:hypothetical protein D3C87_2115080 [compost metagenome]
MTLAAMVGVVVEEMGKRRGEALGDGRGVADRRIGKAAGKCVFAETGDEGDDAIVLGSASSR